MLRVGALVGLVVGALGCGSVDSIEALSYGDGSADVAARQDASGDSDILGGFDRLDIVADQQLTEPSPPSCVWAPLPHKTTACDDGVHAVCCYTVQDGSCDGRLSGCWDEGRECVLQCG